MAGNLIALIGAGGKTTAMGCLACEAAAESVLVTTTTHIYPMREKECAVCLVDPDGQELMDALSSGGIVCAGSSSKNGKLQSLPQELLSSAIGAAELTVYEADGAHRHPLKLHREDEPVLLPGTGRCLIVAGLCAIGTPIGEAIHRYTLNPDWVDAPTQAVGIPEFLYCVLETAKASGFSREEIRIYLNQLDTLADPGLAEILAAQLQRQGYSVRCGSLRQDASGLLSWVLAPIA